MLTVQARAMASPTRRLRAIAIRPRILGPRGILVDIDCAGTCGTDVHHARAEFGHTFAGE